MKKLFKILLFIFAFYLFTLAYTIPLNPAGNWYQQFIPSIGNRTILDITFLDSLTGYSITSISSDTSYVLKTTNGGDSWIINYRAPSSIFRRIQFVNNNTGFIGGQNLFKTTNSGVNWTIIYPSLFSEDMYFTNSDTAWYADPNSLVGGVYRTTNGGVSWDHQLNIGSSNPEKIYMFNQRIGYISRNQGSSGYVRKTTDGGITWNLIVSNDYYLNIGFADSLTGWKNSAFGMKKTTDGGLNWVLQTIPFGGIIQNGFIFNFALQNKDTLWGIGGYVLYPNSQTRGIIYRTINGGAIWQFQIPDTSINMSYSYIYFTNKNSGWVYSNGPTGIHTTTGGDPVWLTGIDQISTEIPKEFKLHQNYPNPFNPATKIKYQIANNRQTVKLIIFEITGKEIIKLVDQKQNAGTYEVDFHGNAYSSGVYFYKLIVSFGKEVYTDTKKMLLVK